MTRDACGRGLTRRWLPAKGTTESSANSTRGIGLAARIFACRGLGDEASARAFLEPTLTQLHSPDLLPNSARAAERLLSAVDAGEPVAIYGDYDVDGVAATAILYHTLRALAPAADLRTYVPHRMDEGYGLNEAAIRSLAAEGARVIVSVDCGVTAIGPARAARDAGVDLIITDHHNPPAGELPDAYAIVHPRLPGSGYPFPELSGAGVAFKLAWKLATVRAGSSRVPAEVRSLLVELLAFAALGTIADIVPLLGENRVIARHGLARIKHSPLPGIRPLVEASGLAGDDIDSEHVGFTLGPRLNACGRLGHAREAVELFTTATGARATEIAKGLSALNTRRRAIERQIADSAAGLAEAAGMAADGCRAIVLAHADWHVGVIGIACSRLVDRFGRPTILMQDAEGFCKGSGRSIAGFSLHAALHECADVLDSFGGHDMAAGLRLRSDRLPEFVDRFTRVANERIGSDDMVASLCYDTDAALHELSAPAIIELDRLAPFGMSNPRPRVRLRGLTLTESPRPLGTTGKHVALMVADGHQRLRLVGWNWADHAAALGAGAHIEAIISPKVETWAGRTRVEGVIEDIMLESSTPIAVS
ncbi:MAG: single-stranded-DNA-specific exonuclease RecJ [Phycisphaerales bacterium]